MSESRDLVPVAPLLVTVAAVIGLTSAVWAIFWQQHHEQRADTIAQLRQRLEQAEAERSRLLDRYTTAEESRHARELELASLRKDLENTQQLLSAVKERNWPERYAALERENYDLTERIEEVELNHRIKHDKQLAEFEQLQNRHHDLQNTYNKLEREHAVLEQRLQTETSIAEREAYALDLALDEMQQKNMRQEQLQHALERDLINREIDAERIDTHLERLERERQALQAALAESEQRIQALNRRNAKLTTELQKAQQQTAAAPPGKTLTSKAPPPAATATNEDSQSSATPHPGFRLARLESLQAAMQGASSSDRKSIIMTVIPTIPGGVAGTELAGLVAGMESRHIIEVIEGSRPHIQRPVDNDSYERIMQHLEDEDSRRLVTRLLQ